MPITSINQVYSELDADSRKNAYFELLSHRIAKKRFARPQVGTRGGPRKGPSFLKAKVVGFHKELATASRFGITKEDLIQFLKDLHQPNVNLFETADMEEVSTDVSKESKIDNTASEVKSEESQNADDDTEAHVNSSETNAVESS